jgi:hypothetical protein
MHDGTSTTPSYKGAAGFAQLRSQTNLAAQILRQAHVTSKTRLPKVSQGMN